MNKRQKKKKLVNENKKLIKEYPFLHPYNVWTGEKNRNYDYTYTLLDDLPAGWKKAFGKLICEDIKKVLIKNNDLDNYQITQIKEKYGSLRWYCNGNEEIQNIIMKYEHISQYICIICGKVNVPIFNDGWISPFCIPCYKNICCRRNTKLDTNSLIEKYKADDANLTTTFKVTRFSKNGNETTIIDCTDILKRMNVDITTLKQ